MIVTRYRYWLVAGIIFGFIALIWLIMPEAKEPVVAKVSNEKIVQQVQAEDKPPITSTSASEPKQTAVNPIVDKPTDEFALPIDKLQQLLPANKEGKVELTYPDGQKKIQGKLENGKPVGLWRNWYANGQLALEMSWKQGLPNGKTRSWYMNGQRRGEINFVNGQAQGRWQRWYNNGQIKQDMHVNHGVVQTMTKWDEQGHLIADLAVNDNQVSGVVLSWYDSGAKKSESVFEKNELVRKVEWDEDGNIVDLNDN